VARSGFLDFADGKSQDKFLQFGTPRSGSDFLDFSDAATGVEQDISRRRTFADSAIDFVVDQLDPLNLALLAASFGGAGLAARIAKPLISTTAGAILTRTSAAAGTQVAEAVAPSLFSRIAHRALIGTGGIIPFAAAELIEEPEPGTTRIGNFSRSLLTMELIDAAFIAAGGTLFGGFARGAKRAISNATRQSVQDATRVSVAAGIAPEEALNIAITDVLEVKLKTHAKRFGPEKTRKLMGFLRQAASADEGALGSIAATRLLSENPEIIQALGQVGLGPDDLARAFEGELASVPRRAVAAQTAERAAEKEAFRKLSAIDSLGPSPAAATPGGLERWERREMLFRLELALPLVQPPRKSQPQPLVPRSPLSVQFPVSSPPPSRPPSVESSEVSVLRKPQQVLPLTQRSPESSLTSFQPPEQERS